MTACNSKSTDKTIEKTSAVNSTIQTKVQRQDSVDIKIDILKINNQQYIQTLKDRNFSCLLSIKGDTIVKEDHYSEAKFLDINNDGYKDIRVFGFTNTPNQCVNYLYDKKTQTFKLIDNCYLDITKIEGTDFFYSYERGGCGDLNWESYLSKIENYRLVNYGYIHGQGCDFEIEKYPQIIEIYKVSNSDTDEKKLFKQLPYQKHIKEFRDKWTFIENYWTRSYKTFER